MVAGLPVKDSMSDAIRSQFTVQLGESQVQSSSLSICSSPVDSPAAKVGKKRGPEEDTTTVIAMKKQKLRIELELLQMEQRKRALEIFALEKKFNLPHCDFTKKL